MKRVLTLMLCAAIVTMLAACGGGGNLSNSSSVSEDIDAQISDMVDAVSDTYETKDDVVIDEENVTEQQEEAVAQGDEEETAEKENIAVEVEEENLTEEITSTGIRPDFKEAMDAYEAFYKEYCEFMKKYNDNPSDLKLLAEYGEMLVKAAEMDKALEEWDEEDMNDEELQYYLEVNSRVLQMLADAAN